MKTFYKVFEMNSSNMFEIKIKPFCTTKDDYKEKIKGYKVNLDYLYNMEPPSPPKLSRTTAEIYEPIKLYSQPFNCKIIDTEKDIEYSTKFIAHMGPKNEILGFYDEKILMYSLSGQKFLSSCADFKNFTLDGAYKNSVNKTQFYFREEKEGSLFVIEGNLLKKLLYYSNKKYT